MNLVRNSIIICFLWGLNPVLHKILLKDLNENAILIYTSMLNFVMMLGFAYANREAVVDTIKKLTLTHVLVMAAMAGLCEFLGNYFYSLTLQNNTSFVTVSLTSLYPIFTMFLGYLILNESVTKYSFVGLIFIIIGMMAVTYVPKE
jgi:drug/metabolite transporter (DMT)-like permease